MRLLLHDLLLCYLAHNTGASVSLCPSLWSSSKLLRYLEESRFSHVTCQNLVQSKADSFVSLMQVTGGVWTFSRICCDIFVTMDVMMCTASILNLCAISIDRWDSRIQGYSLDIGVSPVPQWGRDKEVGWAQTASVFSGQQTPEGLSLPLLLLMRLCKKRSALEGKETQAIKHPQQTVNHILRLLKGRNHNWSSSSSWVSNRVSPSGDLTHEALINKILPYSQIEMKIIAV